MQSSASWLKVFLTLTWVGAAVLTFCFAHTTSQSATTLSQYLRPSQIPFPAENRFSPEKARLGEMLFFDPLLSGSGTRSCAGCHNPSLSWTDGLPRGLGEGLEAMPVRTPTLLDVAWVPKLGWDGHFRDLESVAFGPIANPKIMNMTPDALVSRLSAIPGYARN